MRLHAIIRSLFPVGNCGCSSVDRVLASEAKGRGFDPRQPHHSVIPASAASYDGSLSLPRQGHSSSVSERQRPGKAQTPRFSLSGASCQSICDWLGAPWRGSDDGAIAAGRRLTDTRSFWSFNPARLGVEVFHSRQVLNRPAFVSAPAHQQKRPHLWAFFCQLSGLKFGCASKI